MATKHTKYPPDPLTYLTEREIQHGINIKLAKAEVRLAKDNFNSLMNSCKHKLPPMTVEQRALLAKDDPKTWSWRSSCVICGENFGHLCPESPDQICHYHTSGGFINLIDGRKIAAPANHDVDYETEDSCIFCHQPEERK